MSSVNRSAEASRDSMEQNTSTAIASHILDVPPLFALIVGINDYASHEIANLLGAVPDADAVRAFLRTDMNVPEGQIHYLKNEAATRSNIINGFKALRDNVFIQKGDPILIYFSGHGAEMEAPVGWEAGGSKIQMIAPYDYLTEVDGKKVHGIPDRTISSLLEALAREKGDNITVILDCCHSGSGTRAPNSESPIELIRCIEPPPNIQIPVDLDRHIWHAISDGTRGAAIPAGFLRAGLKSHVLLAACSPNEYALEANRRGIFTNALLATIREAGANRITYSGLLARMGTLTAGTAMSILQHPQCEGVDPRRILFNSKAASYHRVLHEVQVDGKRITIKAGSVHGLIKGAEYTIYPEQDYSPDAIPLGTLVVHEVDELSSVLRALKDSPPFTLPTPAYALETKSGKGRTLVLSVEEELFDTFQQVVKEVLPFSPQHIRLVRKPQMSDAEIHIALDEAGQVALDVLDPSVAQAGLTRVPFRVDRRDTAKIRRVIEAAANYYWHLRRTASGRSESGRLGSKVRLEFRKLRVEFDDELNTIVEPEGEDLNINDTVEIIVSDSESDVYGIKIVNTTSRPLHPYLLFFDNSDFSIMSYSPNLTAGRFEPDAALAPYGSLTLGYGSGGTPPYRYFIRDGQAVDVGFLKLFLASRFIDLSHITQQSPFHEPELAAATRGTAFGKPARNLPDLWDSKLVMVVQIRKDDEDSGQN